MIDPYGYVLSLRRPVAIDEVQRVPDLLGGLKRVVDDDPASGAFVITGSANLQTLPLIADALPGRVDYLRLDPLAEREIEGASGSAVDDLFAGARLQSDRGAGRAAYAEAVLGGGFPDARRRAAAARGRFFAGYVASLVARDVPTVAALRTIDRLGDVLRLVAARSGSPAEPHALGGELGLDGKTVRAHIAALERTFALRSLPAWSTNLDARVVRSPRTYVADAGLLAHLLGASAETFRHDLAGDVAGRLLETFAVNELLRQSAWSTIAARASYYRGTAGREIDLILEAGRSVVGVEIKAATAVSQRDARHLAFLRDRLGDRFVRGVVLYTGTATVPLGDRLEAAPIASLYSST